MSPKTIGIIALFAFTAPVIGQTRKSPYDRKTSKRSVKSTRKSTQTIKKGQESKEDLWELNLSIGSQTFETSDDPDGSKLSRIELNMGRMFRISENMTTTSLAAVSLSSIGQDKLNKANADESNVGFNIDSSRFTDIGIAQKLSYEINSSIGKLKPFVQGHYSVGNWTTNIKAAGLSGELDMVVDYKRYGGTVGMELVLDGGIVPFVKYSIDEYEIDRNGKVEGNVGGISLNDSIEVDNTAGTANTLSVGLGVTF